MRFRDVRIGGMMSWVLGYKWVVEEVYVLPGALGIGAGKSRLVRGGFGGKEWCFCSAIEMELLCFVPGCLYCRWRPPRLFRLRAFLHWKSSRHQTTVSHASRSAPRSPQSHSQPKTLYTSSQLAVRGSLPLPLPTMDDSVTTTSTFDASKLTDNDKRELQQFLQNEAQKSNIQQCTAPLFSLSSFQCSRCTLTASVPSI